MKRIIFVSEDNKFEIEISDLLDELVDVISINEKTIIKPNKDMLKLIKNNIKKDSKEESKRITRKELQKMMDDDSFWD